jgi:hypothetical protein
MRNAYKMLVGNSEGMKPIGRPRHRWEDNVKMDFREIGMEGDSNGLGWGPVAGSCERGNEPSGSMKGEKFLD